jgi:glucose-1-phosphate adenylyltransferase
MQDVFVSEGVVLENVIIDKKCVIRPGIKLLGSPDYPVVIGKGAIV